jgi:hypothetical protein
MRWLGTGLGGVATSENVVDESVSRFSIEGWICSNVVVS